MSIKDEILFISEVIKQLNIDRIQLLNNEEFNDSITIDNVFTKIEKHKQFGSIFKEKISEEIEFISENFYILVDNHKNEIMKLDEEILNQIFSNSKLRLNDEDQLLNFINELFERHDKTENFYENVIFKNVTSKSMKEFVRIFDYEDLNKNIWLSILSRLECEIRPDTEEDEETKERNNERYTIQKQLKNEDDEIIKTFLHSENNEFNGIIKYLTDKTGGNIHDNKTIEVTTNTLNQGYQPKNLLNFNQNDFYYTEKSNDQNAWVCFDFKNMKIEISSYSIKSHTNGPGAAHIKNWVIEISNDQNKWTKIDEHSNYSGLNGSSITKTFDVNDHQFARFCRIRNVGEYYGCSSNVLALNCIEFYGRLKESK